jgi:hypothetical protein
VGLISGSTTWHTRTQSCASLPRTPGKSSNKQIEKTIGLGQEKHHKLYWDEEIFFFWRQKLLSTKRQKWRNLIMTFIGASLNWTTPTKSNENETSKRWRTWSNKSSQQKIDLKPTTKNNFWLFGKTDSADPYFVVSARTRANEFEKCPENSSSSFSIGSRISSRDRVLPISSKWIICFLCFKVDLWVNSLKKGASG